VLLYNLVRRACWRLPARQQVAAESHPFVDAARWLLLSSSSSSPPPMTTGATSVDVT